MLSLLLYGSECWVVSAENFEHEASSTGDVFGSCSVQGHSPPSHSEASHLDRGAGGEAGHPRHQALCSFEGAETPRAGHVSRMDADWTPSLLQRCWVVDGKQPSGKIKVLYDSAVQKLLDEVGLSLLDAANKSEWHNITRPEALAAQARAASGFSAQVAAKRPSGSAVTKGAASSTRRRQHANLSLAET